MRLTKILRDVGDSVFGSAKHGFNQASLTGLSYPIDWEFTLQDEAFYFHPKDNQGVPINSDRQGGFVYFPTRVSTYAFAHLNRHVERGDAASRELFLRMAEWFMAVEDGIWRYHCDYNFGADVTLRSPWISGMAQGEGISVLARAFRLTGDERYLARARQAIAPLLVPLGEGGVRSQLPDGSEFLEEYPLPAPRHVLNGFLYSLIGLLDLAELAPEEGARVGLDRLVTSLKRNFDLWDLGYWSAYDAYKTPGGRRNPATVAYHRVHVAQLRYLGAKLKDPVLSATAERWFEHQRRPWNRLRALHGKLGLRAVERPSSFRATTVPPAAPDPAGSR